MWALVAAAASVVAPARQGAAFYAAPAPLAPARPAVASYVAPAALAARPYVADLPPRRAEATAVLPGCFLLPCFFWLLGVLGTFRPRSVARSSFAAAPSRRSGAAHRAVFGSRVARAGAVLERGASRTTIPLMAAYYETIEGVKYDREALDAAREAVSGKGDGRVSLADARAILETITDGGGVTAIEFRTAFYILGNFKFTSEAAEYYVAELSKADAK